jgi:hypothetical protein
MQAQQQLRQFVSSSLSQAYEEGAEMKEHEDGIEIHEAKENEWVEESISVPPAQ